MFLSASRFDCKIAPKGVIFLVECPSYTVVYSGLGLPQGYLSTCLDYAFRGMCSCGSKSHLSLADDRGCAGWCNLRVAQTSPLLVTRHFYAPALKEGGAYCFCPVFPLVQLFVLLCVHGFVRRANPYGYLIASASYNITNSRSLTIFSIFLHTKRLQFS